VVTTFTFIPPTKSTDNLLPLSKLDLKTDVLKLSVLPVVKNVPLVLVQLTIVSNVKKEELMLHLVNVQLVTILTKNTNVDLVLLNVKLVALTMSVLNVLMLP
jgi:hypothetical protein